MIRGVWERRALTLYALHGLVLLALHLVLRVWSAVARVLDRSPILIIFGVVKLKVVGKWAAQLWILERGPICRGHIGRIGNIAVKHHPRFVIICNMHLGARAASVREVPV